MKRYLRKVVVIVGIAALAASLLVGSALAAAGEPGNDPDGNRLAQMVEWMGPENWGQMIQQMTQIHGAEWTAQMLQHMSESDGSCDGSGAGNMMGHGFVGMMGQGYSSQDGFGPSGMMGYR